MSLSWRISAANIALPVLSFIALTHWDFTGVFAFSSNLSFVNHGGKGGCQVAIRPLFAISANEDVAYCILEVDQKAAQPQRSKQIEEISRMCIEVFFNDNGSDNVNSFTPPWKSMQLAYLRNVQYGDLMMRQFSQMRSTKRGKNEMYVARRVTQLPKQLVRKSKVDASRIVSRDDVYNVDILEEEDNDEYIFVADELLGFCEVTAKPFGLGPGNLGYSTLEGDKDIIRPVITNLAVRADARKLGLGRELVQTVYDTIQTWENYNFEELVLQVEEDNEGGLKFYEKLGFQVVFTDPACRRYDTNGLFLRQVQVAKIAMKKDIVTFDTKEKNRNIFNFPLFENIFSL